MELVERIKTMSKTTSPVLIIGAGITGLSLGYFLSRKGIPSIVLEKEAQPGGLARSFHYDGFTFDIGPHRFHTDNQSINQIILNLLGSEARHITRQSRVCFERRFYPWPLHPSYVLLRFPLHIALSVFLDLFHLYRKAPAKTFKDQIINMYGPTLFRHFFEGYSSKFLGIVPELTHPDWAQTGIDRAIIDNRLKIHNLQQLLFQVLIPRRDPQLRFVYPAGGCGRFAMNLADQYVRQGGVLRCGQAVEAMEIGGTSITGVQVSGQRIEPSWVVWTGPVHSLAALLHQPAPDLKYLALVCYNLILGAGPEFDFQWSYHGRSDVIFSRVSIPKNFDPGNTPSGQRSMCVEVTCYEEDEIYQNPNRFLDRLLIDLKREGLLRTDHEVQTLHLERFPWAYPIYRIDYRDQLQCLEQNLAGYNNLIRAGRLGSFWYNNMDHCLEASLRLAEEISSRSG